MGTNPAAVRVQYPVPVSGFIFGLRSHFRPEESNLSDLDAVEPEGSRQSVFLSYASEDREAARQLRDALPGYGLEVWYDESDLGGGEAWDQKIRRQIRDCDYFMPIVSARTEARVEGYFRREWRLAVERTLDMADDHTFLLPIVIDDTNQAAARVPEKFLTVQWLKVPAGRPTSAFETMCRRLAGDPLKQTEPARRTADKTRSLPSSGSKALPPFPYHEPGQTVRFWVEVMGWAFRWTWAKFQRMPRWIRVAAYIWLSIALVARCTSSDHRGATAHHDATDITPAKLAKLKAISDKYQTTAGKDSVGNLGSEIAKQFSDDPDDDPPEEGTPLLALAFTAPADDPEGQKLADTTFAMTYGRLTLSHSGAVGLTKAPLSSRELGAGLERARANHSAYVLWGTVDPVDGAQSLAIKIVKVADGSVVWAKSYRSAEADPAKVAAEVNAHLPSLQ
jgi:hypothetical protein